MKESSRNLFSRSAKVSGQQPRITIVIPSLNQAQFIEKTITSVISQEYDNLELILIDGGSNDGTMDIVKKYLPFIGYVESVKDRGQSHAINKGFSRATGALLSWLNTDDYLLPGALNALADAYKNAKPSTGAITGCGNIVDGNGTLIREISPKKVDLASCADWFYGSDFSQPSCFFTKEAWKKCGPLDENLDFALDYDLWMKIAKHFDFMVVDKLLSNAVAHQGAKTTSKPFHSIAEGCLVLIKHGFPDVAKKIMFKMADRLSQDVDSKMIGLTDLVSKLLRKDP